jgi:S1-C subfamily serine protease
MSPEQQQSRPGSERAADGPPGAWQRHDLLVVLAALALLAGGRLAHHSLAQPRTVELSHMGLRLERPRAWLPPVAARDAPSPLASGIIGSLARASDDPGLDAEPWDAYHVVFTSPGDALTRMEVRVGRRPRYGNLAGAIGFIRRAQHGEMYRSFGHEVVTIEGRRWLRARFRYAFKPDMQASPRIATGIEYTSAQGPYFYSVTFHGQDATVQRLAELIAPTLAIDQEGSGQVADDFQAASPAAKVRDPALAAAMSSTVMIVVADLIDGRLEPVSGGSGVLVSSDGAVLTNAHIIRDEAGDRLHDLFAIGRFRAVDRKTELVCAGFPERSEIAADLDLALLRCDLDMSGRTFAPKNWPAIAIGRSETLIPGEPIRVLGYPDRGGGGLHIAAGEVMGWTGANGTSGQDYVKTSAEITSGSSGAAVINEDGALIGVATAYRLRAELVPDSGSAPGLHPGPEPAVPSVQRIGLVRPLAQAEPLLDMARSGWASRTRHRPGMPVRTGPADSGQGGVMVTSKVVDAANDQPIAGAMIIVFAPGIDARDLDLLRLEEQALAWGQTNEDGEFLLHDLLLRGERYTVAVLAEGYHPLTGDGALMIHAATPDFFDPWGVVRLARK